MTGYIETIFGPMFSGKSTELQKKIRRFRIANKRCLVINFSQDNRYSSEDVAVTHDFNKIDAKKLNSLGQLTDLDINSHDVIGVDEGQFFPDLVDYADKWANQGKIVVISALDSTFERKPFGRICELVAISEYIHKLSAVCINCGEHAMNTKRMIDSTDLVLVGGAEIYKPVCRKCFNQPASTIQVNAKLEANVNDIDTDISGNEQNNNLTKSESSLEDTKTKVEEDPN